MRVTAEQIECANLVNLPEFLESQGFSLKKVGKEYVLKEHDSLHIKDNKFGERGKWFQFSADEGGNNIQFVQKFMGLDFISAVELLSDEKAVPTKVHYYCESKAEPLEKREIAVHDSKDITRMTNYLHVVRGLSASSLARLIVEGKLSQEEKTGNAVFKIFDENGLLVGAEKVGTSGGKFKSIEKGSAIGYGFEMTKGNPVNAYFFESAIDAVSFADLHPELDNYRLISMAGVKPSVVEETMKRYAVQPENIYICTDNDKAGNKFAEKLIAQYPAMKRVTPQGAKDWNDILQGRVEKMKLYGNTYWQEATDNRDKTVAVMHEDTFRQLQETLDKSGLNYCAYSDGKNAMVAVNSSEVDRFRTVTGLDESLCRLQKSGREHIPQDKNIIGNTDYKYIPQKTYINDDRETILKMAELANKANIQFSARIYPSGKAAMTVSQVDMTRISAIRDEVKTMRKPMIQNSRQASQEIIGNKPYREIRNRHFFVSPLTPEKYHKIEPKLFERGAEFSGLIRDGKVMFTTEREQAQRFNAILRQTVSENQILENLQNMGLDSKQIQALSSAIEIASRNNMANIIENYVSKDYDISQLSTMNNLLIAYLDQNDTSRFLDNGRQLDLLLSTKQKFDLQIAQREELASFEEIYNPENDEIPENSLSFHFGDKDSEWFTESDLLYDFVQKNPDMSFALANAIIEYLDENQHSERNIPELHAGWYKKTDFTVTTEIDGQNFTHSGRFDIGDGKGTGGGTLIDHIEQFAKGALAQGFPYNSEDDRKSLNYLLDNVVPFLKENAEMTAEEINIFNSFKNDNPIRTFADVEIAEPPAIADFREKTEENFRFYNFKPVEVENIVKDFVQRVFEENGVTAEIHGAVITGSRSRGLENADSDIDVVIEIDSDLKEDALFNIIHDEELTLEGYAIDINPIKADETGTLETYLPAAEAYLTERSQHMKEHETKHKSDLPTFDVYIYDKESGANSPMRCQAKNAEEAMKMADEYIKRWNLIEAEIIDVQLVEPEKELAKNEPITEKSAETGIADDAPLFDEKLQTLQQVVNKFFGTDCESAETEHGTWKFAIDDGDKVGELFYGGEPVCGIYNRGDKMEIEPYHELDTFPKLLQTAMREHNHDKPVEIMDFQRDFETPLDKAKYLINDFCESEYGSPADFSDLHNVSLAYTTLTDDELSIQVTADLVDSKITYEFDSEIFNIEQYENIENMIENGLTGLDFSDLVSVPESVIEKYTAKDEQTITTPEIEKSAETEITDDTPLFDESIIAEAGLGFVPDKELESSGNNEQNYEQLTLFGEPEPINKSAPTQNYTPIQYGEPVADVNRFEELHKEIMRGSGFQDGKFRIAEFFQEHNPNNKEFADFLKDEYGTGGHTADDNIFMVDYDSKGMQFTVRSTEGGISDEKFDFNWTEVAKLTADLIKHDKYITQDDIARRNKREDKVEKSKQEVKVNEKSQNFTITDDKLGEGGVKTKFRNNLLAIQTLKQIEIEDRKATPEEQEILSKYVGWGGLAQAFDSNNEQWGKEWSQLFKALTPKEYDEARRSVLDSFFTSPAIIDGIYEALGKFGFSGGNLLEPSCGVGNFLGKMPSEMAEHTHIYGVEIDSISGRIAKQLYPDADIQVTGFENTNFQNGSFDIAVGNVPFGDLNFPDKQYGTTKLHDFFFAQTLDKVKDGGIVAFVTSKGTLDKKDESFRRQLAEKADLIGAVRLPNNAFKANAGTEVTSDIIFLQKRSAPLEELPDWVHLGETADGLRVNSYFAENPEMVLGKIVEGNKLYGRNDDTMCVPIKGADLRQQIHDAVQKLDAKISAVKTNEVFKFSDKQFTMTASELRPFSFFKDDKGDIYLKGGESKLGSFDVTKIMDSKSKDYERMTAFIDLRDTVRELLRVQAEDKPENEIKAVQQKLSTQYDNFYKKYGLLHSRKNRQVLRDDCSYNLLLTLEKEFDKDKLIAKSDIFTKRTVRSSKPIEHVDTALEALAISMAETAKVDLAYMSKLTDMSQEMLISELKGEIFLVPNTGEYQSASEYLSGDIRQKLDVAEHYAESDGRFTENVEALKSAMPEPLKAGDIDVKIGATWISKELYQQFMYELFQTPRENREDVKKAFWVKPKNITVDYSEHTNTWHIENKNADCSVLSRRDFGSKNMNAYEIMEHLLNLKEPKVYKPETYIDQNGDEKERRVVDVKATKIVQQKAAKIRQAFKDWIFKDSERAIPLVEQYNRQFNSIRPREYDGSALRFPGMNSAITLKEHQKNAIAHALFGGNTLFAHCVGAGKSATRS